MKKILILFALTLGLTSFTVSDAVAKTDVIYENTSLGEVVSYNYSIDLNYEESTDDSTKYCCTATVTYNGAYQDSFTECSYTYEGLGLACMLANSQALQYISEHS
jgi:hypothetical protein